MLKPQSFCKNISKNIKSIGEYSCLAMCYLYCVTHSTDAAYYIDTVNRAIDKKVIGEDCLVFNASEFIKFVTGQDWSVTKKSVSSVSDIKQDTPVRYLAKGHGGHWVVVNNGKIVFNSLDWSYNVANGVPIEARVLKKLS